MTRDWFLGAAFGSMVSTVFLLSLLVSATS